MKQPRMPGRISGSGMMAASSTASTISRVRAANTRSPTVKLATLSLWPAWARSERIETALAFGLLTWPAASQIRVNTSAITSLR